LSLSAFSSLFGRNLKKINGKMLMKSKICSNVKLILGSQSMARKRILAEMGYDYTIVVCSNCDYYCFAMDVHNIN